MTWTHFPYFAIVAVLLWMIGAWLSWKDRRKQAVAVTLTGLAVFFAFIILFWIALE